MPSAHWIVPTSHRTRLATTYSPVVCFPAQSDHGIVKGSCPASVWLGHLRLKLLMRLVSVVLLL